MGKETEIRILQLETALEWRGGQQQIAYLVRGLLKANMKTMLVCRPQAKIKTHFEQQGLPFFTIGMRHALDLSAARKIARFMKENDFNILHAHSSHALSLGLLVKMQAPAIKLVASRRVDFSVKKPLIGSIKYNNPLIDKIFCISKNIADVLLQDGVPQQKLVIIHSGIDLDRFRIQSSDDLRAELEIPTKHLVVGTVAALVGHKDYPNLLRAAAQVVQKMPEVTFLAVGTGNELEKLKILHKSLELGDRFRFLGFRSDLERFYSLFDVFVLSSHKEGLGTSVLDALACGVPVVATRAGGIPEMIENEVNGLLVPPKEPEALAKALLRILQDSRLRKRLAQNARPSAEKFSFVHMVEKHIKLYRKLLSSTASL